MSARRSMFQNSVQDNKAARVLSRGKASVPSSRRRVANQALPKREYSNRESIHKYVS